MGGARQFASRSLLLLVLLAPSSAAQATVLTRCGPSNGTAYYFENPLVAKDKAGWTPDGISSGSLQLIVDGTEADVVATDSAGTKSAKADGFTIVVVPGVAAGRVLLVGINARSGAVQHWLFNLDTMGRGTVVWGTIRGGGMLPKSDLMKADCTRP